MFAVVRKVLPPALLLILGIAIPATFHAAWFVYALWIAGAVVAAILVMRSEWLKAKVPFEVRRKDPAAQRGLVRLVSARLLRDDLKQAWEVLRVMTDPTAAELRAWADNMAARLRDDGYDVSAKQFEVVLPDNAPLPDVKKRRSEVQDLLLHLLMFDDYR
jgi:hypothetical protein